MLGCWGVKFVCQDILEYNYATTKVNCFICFEVLEHLKDDKKLLSLLPKGTRLIFSVPNYDSPSHVRYFESMSDVFHRYNDELTFKSFHHFDMNERSKIFLFDSYVR